MSQTSWFLLLASNSNQGKSKSNGVQQTSTRCLWLISTHSINNIGVMDHHHHHHHHHHQGDLPGFRFHPTEEELLDFYLNNMVFGNKLGSDIIGYLNIYDHHPRALPGLSKIGEREWYFFVPRDRKHGTGGRPNRTTANGFWKATGSDRKIVSLSEPKRVLGLRKTLVFYYGRAPRGTKTDWVMNEYRFPDTWTLPKDIVLCKIYRKATSLKVLEQRAAMEEEMKDCHPRKRQRVDDKSPPSSSSSPLSLCGQQEDAAPPEVAIQGQVLLFKEEAVEEMVAEGAGNKGSSSSTSTSLQFPVGRNKLPELQVPSKLELDWNTPDGSFWLSPWIPSFTTPPSLGNMLNFYA